MKRWTTPTGALVVIFVLIFLWFLATEAEADTVFEVSPVVAFGGDYAKQRYAVVGSERFAGKYDIGVVLLIDESTDAGNRGFQVSRIVKKGPWELGIGYALWAKTQPEAWSTDETFSLHIGYQRGRWGVRWRHWSTAGTSDRNRGMDMLTIGYRFGRD